MQCPRCPHTAVTRSRHCRATCSTLSRLPRGPPPRPLRALLTQQLPRSPECKTCLLLPTCHGAGQQGGRLLPAAAKAGGAPLHGGPVGMARAPGGEYAEHAAVVRQADPSLVAAADGTCGGVSGHGLAACRSHDGNRECVLRQIRATRCSVSHPSVFPAEVWVGTARRGAGGHEAGCFLVSWSQGLGG